ncbi:hypothetical protein [Crassaminicella profunda]|uniref:hypothetical protein n=1 Tax=Crassaminicella profunda TaxID=1286698 RepID=UPI001CA61A6F|nr:hypothetical protein [Crassaminicella profunda]QZY55098.1 hypothetical protein K7H06_19180 [Crassaminicella profunda]
MIKVHEVIGSLDTTLHDFKVTTEGMKLKVKGTHYTAGGQELFSNYVEDIEGVKTPLEGVEIEITAGYEYQVWLCTDGITILSKEIGNTESQFDKVPENMIDRLAWFKVPEGIATLDDVEINVIEIREG